MNLQSLFNHRKLLLLLLVLVGTWSRAMAGVDEQAEHSRTSVRIRVNSIPRTTINGAQAVCLGATVQYTAASAMASYAWSVTGGVISGSINGQSVSVTWPTAGAGKVFLSYSDTKGCSNDTSINIAVNAGGTGGSLTGGTAVCMGDNSTHLTLEKGVGSVIRWEYSPSPFTAWAVLAGGAGRTSMTVTNLTVSTKYRVVQQSVCGEAVSAEAEVAVHPIPTSADILSTTSTTPVCRGATSMLTATTVASHIVVEWYADAALTHLLSRGNVYTTGRLYNDTTFYARPVNIVAGCKALASEALPVSVSVDYHLHTDYAKVCQYTDFQWREQQIPTSEVGSRQYSDEVHNPADCDSLYVLNLDVLPAPKLALSYSTSTYKEVMVLSPVTLSATPSYYDRYEFTLNNEVVYDGKEAEVTVTSPLFYKKVNTASVAATDEDGCKNVAPLQFTLDVVIPNVFHPGSNGVSGFFMKGYEVVVFNRYGHTLYKGTEGWDGKYKGEDMPVGTYFYEVKLNKDDNTTESVAGSLYLER